MCVCVGVCERGKEGGGREGGRVYIYIYQLCRVAVGTVDVVGVAWYYLAQTIALAQHPFPTLPLFPTPCR